MVDDNSINLFITSQYLRDWGLTHETVDSGEAAKKAVMENKYDIILMDLHMPKMNGYEVSAAIRELRPESTPVIIALSASGRGDVNLKMKRAGISAYVPKPFDPTELQEVMVHFLAGKTGNPGNNRKKEFGKVREQPIPEVKRPSDKAAPVNPERFIELAHGDTTVYNKLMKNALQSIKKLKKEFLEEDYNEKGKKLGRLIHKNTMTLHYLQAQRLLNLLENFRTSLQEEKDESELKKLKASVDVELQLIINSIELLMSRHSQELE